MSIVKMKKMTLVGLSSEKQALLNKLEDLGCVHLKKTDDLEWTSHVVNEESRESLTDRMDYIKRGMKFLIAETNRYYTNYLQQKKYKPLKLDRIVEIKYDDFVRADAQEYELLHGVLDEAFACESRLDELAHAIRQEEELYLGVSAYSGLDVPFSKLQDTTHVSYLMGTIGTANPDRAKKLQDELPSCDVTVLHSARGKTSLVVAYCKEDAESVNRTLAPLEFSRCTYAFDVTPDEKAQECQENVKKLKAERLGVYERIAALAENLDRLKVLYDYYRVALEKVNADEDISSTAAAFILEAWLPAEDEARVSAAVDETLSACIKEFADPLDEELPPTKIKDPKLIAPFEFVTEMKSVPNYREGDPNLWVAIFYFIFFGIIVGDSIYGMLITLGCILALKFFHLRGNTKTLITIFGICGLSAVFWGIMFGSYLGLEGIAQPVLMNPLEQPLLAIGLCLGLGVVQIMFGIGLKGARAIREKRFFDFVCDSLTWLVFFVGVILIVMSMLFGMDILKDIGMWMVLGSLVFVVFTAGRNNKGIFSKIVGGFGGVYGIVNFLSDILSYMRLFGLCLSSAVVELVFNTIALMLFGGEGIMAVVGAIFGLIVMLIGHGLNLALNFLSVYVHDGRLQQIEFFDKFFEGEGYAFRPFASETLYTELKK